MAHGVGILQLAEILERLLAGDRVALAKGITLVENMDRRREELLRLIAPYTGRAHVLGVTGSPGVGKSTLVGALARSLRASSCRVGILAIDPSSPFTGGALLGDRIRLDGLDNDPGCYARSMATRGIGGGLCRAAWDTARLMDAAGFDPVIIETVGVGQTDWEVRDVADTVLVILAPGAGDSIQALKAGIMEIADIFVINKSDLQGAERTRAEVAAVLDMRKDYEWLPPVQPVVALDGSGLSELIIQIAKHREFLCCDGRWTTNREQRWKAELQSAILAELQARLGAWQETPVTEQALLGVISGRLTVAEAANSILQSVSSCRGPIDGM